MPKAEQPRPPARKITEPAYWTDFISHRHPDARVRDFATIQTSYPGLVDEAAEWAKANGRQDVWAS